MPAQECLSPEELHDYVLGKLPEELSRQVAEHLAECPDCENTIASLDGASDTLCEFLKMPRQTSQFADEPHYRRAAEQLKSFDQQSTDGAQLNGDESASSAAPDIRDYRLVQKLGEGGMGAVFKAVHTKLDRTLALKLLRAERMRDRQAVARFEREIKAVGQLDHPAIVRATDAGEIDGTWFLAMELVDGVNLAKLSDVNGPLPVAEACELVRQAAVGLQYVHEQGMVHRDIKPSNLMLAVCSDRIHAVGHTGPDESGHYEPTVKILDLGLALLGGLHGPVDELTTVGQLMGTLDYMAPEQGDDSHDVDIRADIYSLGATLYKLLSGQAPYSGPHLKSPLRKLKALATQEVPPIRAQVVDLPEELARIVHRMLARDPDGRFTTPAEVADALEPFAERTRLSELLERTRGQIASSGCEAESNAVSLEDVSRFLPPGSVAFANAHAAAPVAASVPLRSRTRRLAKIAVGLAAAAAVVLAAFVIYLKTGSGELVIESDQPGVEMVVKRSGHVYQEFQVTHDSLSTSIAAGTYEVTLKGATDGLRIEGDRFTLLRGGTQVVRITRKQTGSEPGNADDLLSYLRKRLIEARIDLESARETYAADHPRIAELEHTILLYQREIAQHQHKGNGSGEGLQLTSPADEVCYEGKTFHEWLAELKTERSPTRLETALEAITAIGQSDHQHEVVQAMFELMRRANFIKVLSGDVHTEERKLFEVCRTGFGKLQPPAEEALAMLADELRTGSSQSRYFALDVARVLVGGFYVGIASEPYRKAAQAEIPAFLQASTDENPIVRAVALQRLGEIDKVDPRIVSRFREALQDDATATDGSEDQSAKLVAARWLVTIDPKAKGLISALRKVVHQKPTHVAQIGEAIRLLKTLARTQPEATQGLLDASIEYLERKQFMRVREPVELIGTDSVTSHLELRKLVLRTLADLGPVARSAVPVIERQFDWPVARGLESEVEDALTKITGKPQPKHYKGRTLRQWCDIFNWNKVLSEREEALASIAQLILLGSGSSRVAPEDSRMVVEAVVTGMRDYDWRQYKDASEWQLMTKTLNLFESLEPAVTEAVFVAELKSDSRNGNLFVLSCLYLENSHAPTSSIGFLAWQNRFLRMPPFPLLDALSAAAEHDDSVVRNRVLWILSHLLEAPTLVEAIRPKLLSVLRRRINDESPIVARLAAKLLCFQLDDSDTVTPFVLQQFKSNVVAEKAFAIDLMTGLKPEVSVPLLVELVRDKSPDVRMPVEMTECNPFRAAGFPEPSGSAALLPSADNERSLLARAIVALGSIGRAANSPEVVAALQELIDSQEPEFAELAADVLRRILPPVTPKPPALYDGQPFDEWKKQLVEKKPERLAEVLTAIGILGAENEQHAREAAPVILDAALRQWGDGSLGAVGPEKVRSAAVDAYQQILSSPDAANRLFAELKNGDSKSRMFGIYVLSGTSMTSSSVDVLPKNLDRKAAIEGLIAASTETQYPPIGNGRSFAIETAAALDRNDDRLKARLIELLRDADPDLVKSAVRILTEVDPGAKGLVDRLIELAKQRPAVQQETDASEAIATLRAQAIYELGQLGPQAKKAVPVLLDVVKSHRRTLLEPVVVGTYYFDENRMAKYVDRNTNISFSPRGQWVQFATAREVAIDALGKLGKAAEKAVPVLEDLLRVGIAEEQDEYDAEEENAQPPEQTMPACTPMEVVTIFTALAQIGPTAKKTLDLMRQRLGQFERSETVGDTQLKKMREAFALAARHQSSGSRRE